MNFVSTVIGLLILGLLVADALLSRRINKMQKELSERRRSQEWLASGWERTENRASQMQAERDQAFALAEAWQEAFLASEACLREERTADNTLFQFASSDEEYVN